jgi:hypothetical protein
VTLYQQTRQRNRHTGLASQWLTLLENFLFLHSLLSFEKINLSFLHSLSPKNSIQLYFLIYLSFFYIILLKIIIFLFSR